MQWLILRKPDSLTTCRTVAYYEVLNAKTAELSFARRSVVYVLLNYLAPFARVSDIPTERRTVRTVTVFAVVRNCPTRSARFVIAREAVNYFFAVVAKVVATVRICYITYHFCPLVWLRYLTSIFNRAFWLRYLTCRRFVCNGCNIYCHFA